MSHGAGGDGGVCDPNLTPLLDLVLQLLMFFMVCVNFVAEQVSGDIRLPTSESAKPIEKVDAAALFLNQKSMKSKEFRDKLAATNPDLLERLNNQDSVVLIPGLAPQTLLEAKRYLKQHYEDAEKVAEGGEVKTVIHFRPDADLELNQLFTLMNYCKAAGYKKLRVRAIVRGGGGA
jgi:biopolymer transport protein ExbD